MNIVSFVTIAATARFVAAISAKGRPGWGADRAT